MELQKDLPAIQSLNAVVLAACVDPVATSQSMVQQLHLGFPILEDTDHQLGSALGDFRVPGGMDMGPVDNHAIFVIGPNGAVAWKQLAPDTMHVPDTAVIDALQNGAG